MANAKRAEALLKTTR